MTSRLHAFIEAHAERQCCFCTRRMAYCGAYATRGPHLFDWNHVLRFTVRCVCDCGIVLLASHECTRIEMHYEGVSRGGARLVSEQWLDAGGRPFDGANPWLQLVREEEAKDRAREYEAAERDRQIAEARRVLATPTIAWGLEPEPGWEAHRAARETLRRLGGRS